MPNDLKSLIKDDLLLSIARPNEQVISGESIRFLIETLKADGSLSNPELVQANEINDFFITLHHEKKACHRQVILESGERSPLRAGDWNTIHYASMDVFCDEEGTLIVFIADHYHGMNFHSFRKDYDQLPPEIYFIAAGGSIYQADSNNCIFFSLRHLQLTAQDTDLQAKLFAIVSSNPVRYNTISWFDLSPNYNLATQSFKTLFQYVEHIHDMEHAQSLEQTKNNDVKHRAIKALPAQMLVDSAFDVMLSKNLNSSAENKIINQAIQAYARALIDHAFLALEQVSEVALIDICYPVKGPAQTLLHKAFEVTNGAQIHPLFEFLFTNQPALNFLTKMPINAPKQLKAVADLIVIIEKLLGAMQDGLIDPSDLFKKLTLIDGKKLVLDLKNLKLLKDNLILLDFFTPEMNATLRPYQITLLDILLLKNTAKILAPKACLSLFLVNPLNILLIPKIRIDLFNREKWDDLCPEQLSSKLNSLIRAASPDSVVDFGEASQYKPTF